MSTSILFRNPLRGGRWSTTVLLQPFFVKGDRKFTKVLVVVLAVALAVDERASSQEDDGGASSLGS